MRAVNLMPAEARASQSRGGRSGGAAHVVLGGLAALVVLVAAWTMIGRDLPSQRAELDRLRQETAVAHAEAAALASYGVVAVARRQRVESVKAVAAGRFDWAETFDALARTVPDDVWLTTMTGTVAPGVAVEGGASGGMRAGLPVPAVDIVGCAKSDARVAELVARLRSVPAVQRVTLSEAEKSTGGGSEGRGDGADCRGSDRAVPKFRIVLFFASTAVPAAGAGADAAPAAAPAPSAGGANGTPAATTPATTPAATPAASTAPTPAAPGDPK